LAGDALLTSLTGPTGEHVQVDRAIYAPHLLPNRAADVADWMNQAHRLTSVLAKAAFA
jgi:hypothetical protein